MASPSSTSGLFQRNLKKSGDYVSVQELQQYLATWLTEVKQLLKTELKSEIQGELLNTLFPQILNLLGSAITNPRNSSTDRTKLNNLTRQMQSLQSTLQQRLPQQYVPVQVQPQPLVQSQQSQQGGRGRRRTRTRKSSRI